MNRDIMKPQLLAVLVIVSLAFFLVAVIASLLFAPASGLKGDGTLVDRGFRSSRYRYTITFPRLVVSEGGQHTFRCKGVPWESWYFALWAVDQTHDSALKGVADTIAAVRLTDSRGRKLLDVEHPLQKWILAHSPADNRYTRFWTYETRDLSLHAGVEYTLSITLTNTERAGPIELEPTMEAGGWDSP